MNDILEKFNIKDNLIKEYKYWYLMIKYNHVKLGSCVIMLKREAFPISEVTSEEMAEYAIVTKDIESALEQTFKPYLVHHLALMFVDKQIHFHIIPRYDREIEFAGIKWIDDGQADPLLQKIKLLNQEILNEIRKALFKYTQ